MKDCVIGRRGILWAGIILIIAAIGLGQVDFPFREPRYLDHRFSYWLDRLPGYHDGGWSASWPDFITADIEGNEAAVRARIAETDRRTRKAIEAIGTNGIGVLLVRLQSHDTSFRKFIRRCEFRLHVRTTGDSLTEEQRRGQAIEAFYRLGETARPAIPALLKLARDSNPKIRSAATFALGGVAPNESKFLLEEYDRTHLLQK